MTGTGPSRVCFDGFVFDPVTGELSGPAGESRLPPKPARLLALLLERPGELVGRDRLARELWPDQHLDVDQALAYTVRQVRAALGDHADQPRFVETLPRRGYRFLGRIEGPAPASASYAGRVWLPLGAAALLAAILAWAWAGTDGWDGIGGERGRAPIRVALLPLVDSGAGAVNDRLTESLLVALTRQPGLEVVGPATTGRYRATRGPQTEVGAELGVAFVVSGGYRPAEEVLFLQLVRVADGGHLFARRYHGGEQEVREQLPGAAAAIAGAAAGEAAGEADPG
ncbi:MAG TPA: winged helix-turn-helix domain-containing protein [Thermoanaerobaculia bacterium]|nr:winged helix-turn-helix domain-containing protein [Thermoanaerobaculia bacterium]